MLPRKSRYGKGVRRALAGTAALEFGLAIPFLAILVTGIVEIGFSMYQAMQVTYAAEAGLGYAAKKGWDSTGITNAAVNSTGLSGMSVTPTQFCACPSTYGAYNRHLQHDMLQRKRGRPVYKNQRLAHAQVDRRRH